MHIPAFYEEIKSPSYIGFSQQAVRDKDGKLSVSLEQSLAAGGKIEKASLERLFCYCYRYNVLPCDLNRNNILVQKTLQGEKWILVDGLGCTDWIPLAQYWAWWGRKKIIRKFHRFILNDKNLRIWFKNSAEIRQYLNQLTHHL